MVTLEITILNNKKKRDWEEMRDYISKSMHCIWFNLNFEEVLVQDSSIKRKGGEICIGERKLINGEEISSIWCG